MENKLVKLLENRGDNYILPFFWQHGEDEETLRDYMRAIHGANIGAVCVESRPHPDFCGEKWWKDMDVILDEARTLGMKVWILDDSHFPTGFANGAMKHKPAELARRSVCCRRYEVNGGESLELSSEELRHPNEYQKGEVEKLRASLNLTSPGEGIRAAQNSFQDDELIALTAVKLRDVSGGGQGQETEREADSDEAAGLRLLDESAGSRMNLLESGAAVSDGNIMETGLTWTAPEGDWYVYAVHTTRNRGAHGDYINMLEEASCHVLIDAVYEPHWEHYKKDFGRTIAGFFSDEPELGNGHLYEANHKFGVGFSMDYPWSPELADALKERFGEEYSFSLPLLWENGAPDRKKAEARYGYMDLVTRLVEKNFSFQIGNWCREHGVAYIGHMIEDNDQHARTGSTLGHFFRGLGGQDMSGIDDIGGQVYPGGEDDSYDRGVFQIRDGEFYHYMLGKLASSQAAIDPLKKGDSMCEIFGNYGWEEGVRLEKYLADHFLVRGVNHYVPHAFSPAPFPDPDCPPHFYAHSHNPQYRHFGCLMAYMNRVCELISGGTHEAPAAVLYHAEGEWTGKTAYSHRIGHILCDSQIDYDYLPQDVFSERERYGTAIEKGVLKVGGQQYRALVVPEMQFVTKEFAESVCEMAETGVPVYFTENYPEGICNLHLKSGGTEESGETEGSSGGEELLNSLRESDCVMTEEIAVRLAEDGCFDVVLTETNNRIRYYHYCHEDGMEIYLLVNEGEETYRGGFVFRQKKEAYLYDAWENCLRPARVRNGALQAEIVPLKSLIVVFLPEDAELKAYLDGKVRKEMRADMRMEGTGTVLLQKWKRSLCKSIDYPAFGDAKEIRIPDRLWEEEPEFSGFARYEATLEADEGSDYVLEITDAQEGAEVFVNGESLGIQIAPPFIYDLTGKLKIGENILAIEIATTLEREMAVRPNRLGQIKAAKGKSGITGEVKVIVL